MMKKHLFIEGMMCDHCQARVKEALESLDGVSQAVVSHENNCADIVMDESVTDAMLIDVIADAGYILKDIQ